MRVQDIYFWIQSYGRLIQDDNNCTMGRISANISTDIPCDLFLNGLCVGFSKQVEQNTAEVMCVTVWIAQLVCNCIQEQVSPWKTKTI